MLNTIEISNGPSREELFDSLRLGKPTGFSFKTEFRDWKDKGFIKGMDHVKGRKDWVVSFSISITPVIHFGSTSNYEPKIYHVTFRYSTETRKGRTTVLSLRSFLGE